MAGRAELFWRLLGDVRADERSRFLFFAGLFTLITLAQTLGLAGTGDCTVDMDFEAEIEIVGETKIRMNTTVTLGGFDSVEERCPAVDSLPCRVRLDVRGEL